MNSRLSAVDLARERNTVKYCRFPYIAGLSYDVNRCFSGTNVMLAFYSLSRISNIYTGLKDPLSKEQQTCVVYKLPCECGLCYVRQTKQFVGSRVKQHISDCRNMNVNKKNQTALTMHHFDLHHNCEFDRFEILDKETNWLKRNISEIIFIRVNETVNKRTDTNNLSILYYKILNDFKSALK